jgi:hypothetical protein
MSTPVPNPRRLSSVPESEDSLGVGRLFRSAARLADEDLPALRWRLRTSQRLRSTRPRLVLRGALAVGVVFLLGGVVGAVVGPFLARKAPGRMTEPAGVASPSRAGGSLTEARRPRPAQPAASPEPGAPFQAAVDQPARQESSRQEPTPVTVPLRQHVVRRIAATGPTGELAASDVPPGTAPPAAAPSSLAVEQALLGRAMRALRVHHDAPTALSLLAQDAQEFPRGALASEVTILRIEALLDLGRQDEALSVLDGAPLGTLPNRDEHLVVRGELRAARARWRDAKQDFDDALETGVLSARNPRSRGLEERALWGRASARSRLADPEGARADLELYLRRFPGGRFAGAAASLLGKVP